MKNKKEPLLIMIVKTLLAVVIFTGLGTIIIGGAYLIGKQGVISLPHYQPSDKSECKIDSDCQLVYTGPEICLPCDTSLKEYKCFLSKEAKKIEEERLRKPVNSILCEQCLEKPQHACKCENGKCEKVKKKLIEEVSITTDKMEYEQGEMVEITIENNSEKEQGMSYPPYIIERFKNNSWIPIKQIWLSCGMFYEEIEFITIKSKDKLKYEWDQQESWCGSIDLLWGEFSNQVQSGKYRIKSIKIGFPDPENYETIYSNEFTIKEKSALDARCSEKIVGIGPCKRSAMGYEFNPNLEKCVEKKVGGCSFEIPFGSLGECQEVCEKNNCAGAGELINYPSGTNKNLPDVCCEGLKALAGFSINENGECEHLKGGPHLTCMPCGNGICETINNFEENECNCLEDCEKNVNVVLPNNNELIRCGNDNDCVLVDNDWCDCSMGGSMNCINKKYLEDWNQKLKLDPKDSINCPAVYLCDYNFTGCECVNNACQGTGGDFLEMVNEELLKSNQ